MKARSFHKRTDLCTVCTNGVITNPLGSSSHTKHVVICLILAGWYRRLGDKNGGWVRRTLVIGIMVVGERAFGVGQLAVWRMRFARSLELPKYQITCEG